QHGAATEYRVDEVEGRGSAAGEDARDQQVDRDVEEPEAESADPGSCQDQPPQPSSRQHRQTRDQAQQTDDYDPAVAPAPDHHGRQHDHRERAEEVRTDDRTDLIDTDAEALAQLWEQRAVEGSHAAAQEEPGCSDEEHGPGGWVEQTRTARHRRQHTATQLQPGDQEGRYTLP